MQFPQTNDTQRHKGSDGKLYHQYNGDEDVNYRTVNENDNLLDSMRSMEMGRTLNMMAGKGDSRGHGQSKSATYVPPKLGTTSKSKKIERKAWEQEMGLTQTAPPASEMNTSSSHDQQLMEAIATLQHKYEENLQVIEQLYLEKKQMAKKVEILEYKLQKSMSPPKPRTASPVPPRYTRSVGKSQPPENQKPNKMNSSNRYHAERSREGERNNQSRLNATSPSILEHVRNDDDEYLLQGDQSLPESPNQDNFLNPSNAISALQAAEMFGEDAPVMTSRSAKSLPTRSSYEPPVNRMTKARPSSAPKMERYSASETPSRGRNPSITGVLSRPSSASRSIKSGPSATLQAETDR